MEETEVRTSKSGDNLLTFDPVKHRYTLNGKIVPGVTTLIKKGMPTPEALIAWKIKMGASGFKKSKAAADVGTITHKYAELKLKGLEKEFDWDLVANSPDKEKVKNTIELFDNYHAKHAPEVVDTEVLVGNPSLGYGGMIDAVVKEGEEFGLIDHKSSDRPYPEHFLQVAGGYSLAYYLWFNQIVSFVQINCFSKTKADFKTLRLDRKGWTWNGKFVKKDTESFTNCQIQFTRLVSTARFVEEFEGTFKGFK